MSSFDSYTTVKNLFVVGTTASAITSGIFLSTSMIHVPAYLKNPSDPSLLAQWRIMFNAGAATVVPLALVSGVAHFANAYATHTQPQSLRFILAGALSVATLPYTLLALGPTNAELIVRADGKEAGSSGFDSQKNLSSKDLFGRWSLLSGVRGWMMLLSTLIGFDAMLHLTF